MASCLVSFYKVQLDNQMIVRALKTNQLYFLYCVWAFNKNFCLKPQMAETMDLDIEDTDSDEETLQSMSAG